MRCLILLLMILTISQQLLAYPVRPATSGDICTRNNPDYKEIRYPEGIVYCRRNVHRNTKKNIYIEYSIPLDQKGHYTIDHIIPLSLGGSNRVTNLWPEHREIKALRHNLEFDLYVMLREGKITQRQAVRIITLAKDDPYRDVKELIDYVLGRN